LFFEKFEEGINYRFLIYCISRNKKAFLKEKGLKRSLYGLVNQDSY